MSISSKKKSPWPEYEISSTDGRRARSDRSRRKIIEAMFELMREGDMTPTAVAVAGRADVGLRTVFRHFDDMDSIFEEMCDEMSAIMMPRFLAPYESTSWQDRLMEKIDRNGDLYELIFPFQVALILRRFQSDFLQKQYNREVKLLRSSLESFLPTSVVSDRTLFSAIEVNLTFATWRRLREDQKLSVADSKTSIKRVLIALTQDCDEA